MVPKQYRQPGFPPCISLSIDFNEHARYYQTAQQWVEEAESEHRINWVSPEERERALASDSVWTCQWYPDTPIGFYKLAASSFEALMRGVNEAQTR